MITWLLLGCGGVGHELATSIGQRTDALTVVEPDEAVVEQLRNEEIDASVGDVTDREAIADLAVEPDVVVIAGKNVGRNRVAANHAAEIFPDSYLLVFAGTEPTRADIEAFNEIADGVYDPGEALVDHLSTVVRNGQAQRLRELHATFETIDGTLGIFTHDNPDPDAIAAAIALRQVANYHGVEAEIAYYGQITHQENRAFVNLLDLDLRDLDPGDDISYDAFALVDHSRPGVNDQLPTDTPVDIVIDHHPSKQMVEATFADVRESVGATSTLLVDYLRGYGIDFDVNVATALLFGIRIDTNDFQRGVTSTDLEAAALLIDHVDVEVLKRIESPSLSVNTLEIIGRAIDNRDRRNGIVTSGVGPITDRDALAQASDRLLDIEGVSITLVYGYMDGTIYASARARGVDCNLGDVLMEAFGEVGSAGGHEDMAGAQIPLGVFDDVDAEEELTAMVEDIVTSRFYDVVDPESFEG